jgi:hypothetical protein
MLQTLTIGQYILPKNPPKAVGDPIESTESWRGRIESYYDEKHVERSRFQLTPLLTPDRMRSVTYVIMNYFW